jgi:hypothetical protein
MSNDSDALGTCTSGDEFSIRKSGAHAVAIEMPVGSIIEYTVVGGRVWVSRVDSVTCSLPLDAS